jgi:ATP-dependent helicase HrpB
VIPDLPPLPIRAALPDLRHALERDGRAVLVAPPGAGKTTLVPLALLQAPWRGDQRILVLEPRRLATRAAAHRMSQLLGEDGPGGTVGYRVRMDTRVGPRTRIEVVTEGVLTRMLQSDAALEGVAAVLFDEFHERSLHADVGLAMSLQSRAILRGDLRILVMSATMDPGPVARLLGDAPVIRTEGREHPVETRWLRRPMEGWIEPAVSRTVRRALDETEGDLLVFLPGAGEIRRTREHLEGSGLPDHVRLHTLHGSLDADTQDRAIRPAPAGTRKVVLASAIAETSLTIEGVQVVVDSGLMRVPRFDPGTGMTRLETLRVSRDSADQRRGRAGREAPGWCYRMWTRGEDRGLVPQRTPEILEADLAPLALELAAWGAAPDDLRWLDPPPAGAFDTALDLLGDLELVGPDGGLTPMGEEVAATGIHPRLGRMLLEGKGLGWGALACDLAALLSDRDVIRAEGRAPDADLRLRVELLRRGDGGSMLPSGHRSHGGALARARREARHWRKALSVPAPSSGPSGTELEAVGLLAALAYPDRIGRRREGQRGRFLLSGGRGARFTEPQSLEGADWIVAVDVEGRGREARIFRAAPLETEHIEAHLGGLVDEAAEIAWDDSAGRVRARRVARLGAIELSSASLPDPDPSRVVEALLAGIRSRGIDALPWGRDTARLRDRLQFLHHLEAERWPDTSSEVLEEELEEWLLPFLAGQRSWEDLRRVDLKEALLSRLDWADRNRLDELSPTHLEVPSGSRVPVDYSDPQRPALAVRLQEVFGWQVTPRVGGGRVPLVMKLLSPAHRPVQVTTDLASFWQDAYFEVRKDLRGRYPKHYWPEDPLTATPTRRVRPPSDGS